MINQQDYEKALLNNHSKCKGKGKGTHPPHIPITLYIHFPSLSPRFSHVNGFFWIYGHIQTSTKFISKIICIAIMARSKSHLSHSSIVPLSSYACMELLWKLSGC